MGPHRISGAGRAPLRRALLLTTALTGFTPFFVQTAAALDVVVTNTNDSGAGSLRAAITTINASVDPANNITFGNGFQGQITLLSNLPTITKPVNIDFAGDPTIFGGNFLAGSFGLGAAAAGNVVAINNSHLYSGNTTLTAGTLQVGVPINGSAVFGSGKSLLVMSAGTIFDIPINTSATFQNISGAGTITNNGSGNGLTINGGNTTAQTFAGTISGTGKLSLPGGGDKLTLSGSTTYSGDTNIFGDIDFSGTSVFKVELAAGATNALSPNSAFFMIGAGTLRLNGFNQTIGSLDGGTVSGAVPLVDLGAATLTTGGNNTSTNFFGSLIGTGGLTKVGTGTMTLTSSLSATINSQIDYSGATLVSAGTLQSGNANAFSANSAHTVNAGATLDLNNFNNTIASLAGAGNVTLGSGILTTGGNNSSTTFSGVMSGTGGLTKAGTGTFILSGDNTFTGTTTISAGTLQLGNGGTGGAVVGNIVDNAILAINHSNTVTLPGVISGTGVFNQIGTGTTVFTNDNTYTGLTTISAGTLQLGNGGTTGSIVGDVVDNGTLAFNRSNALTFGGVISGTGAVQQNGTGSTNLTGTNTYTGATTVNAGTLFVNGSIASSSGLTVNAGATIGGSGFLPKTTINGGTLSPGNSIGTVSISGSLTFVGAGNYIVEVSPAAADKTNVSGTPGTATLAGTLSAVGTGGSYTAGTKYTVLNTTGGVSGTFSSLAISGSFGGTKPHVEYDANNVYLVLDPNALPLTGLTFNQRSAGTAINTSLQAGNQSAPFLALFNLSAAQLPGALDQLSGEVHPSTASVLLDESLYARSAILGRLRQASYGGDTQMASLASGGPMAYANGEEMTALAYAKSPIVTKAPPLVSQPGYDVVFWAQGFGGWGRFDTDGNAAAVRRDLAGFFSGVDTKVGTNGRLGIAAGYTGSRNALDNRGSSTVESGHLAGYGGWSFGNFNLRAGADYAWHTIDTSRTVVIPGFFDTDTAHYNGATAQIFGEAGYGFAFGKVAVEPFAGAAFVRLQTDGASERGGAAALNVAANAFEVGYSTFGIRAATAIPLAYDMMLVPRASAAWQHAFDTVTPADTLTFQAAGVPFAIAGVPISRDALLAEAGLDLAIGRSATIGIAYVGQIANNVQDHAAKGRFSWKF
ncbi:MAG: autotransporter domain-containing protein [Alphaproteobacteria bacterium]